MDQFQWTSEAVSEHLIYEIIFLLDFGIPKYCDRSKINKRANYIEDFKT